jgi:ATP-binding cassette subfamily B (MDR/TAP) protein 8
VLSQVVTVELANLGTLFGNIIKAKASSSRVFQLIHMEPTIPLKGGIVPLHAPSEYFFIETRIFVS